MTRFLASALFLSFTLLALHCSSSQGAGAGMEVTRTAEGATVPVELDDYEIRMPEEIPAGEVTFDVRNVGGHDHTIAIHGNGVEAALPSHLKPGEHGTLHVHLDPGEYSVTCPIGPHETLGMRLTLTVQ